MTFKRTHTTCAADNPIPKLGSSTFCKLGAHNVLVVKLSPCALALLETVETAVATVS